MDSSGNAMFSSDPPDTASSLQNNHQQSFRQHSFSQQQQQQQFNTNSLMEEIDFDAYTDKELLRLQVELQRKVQWLESENFMFEGYLVRVTPQMGKDADEKTDQNQGGKTDMGQDGQDRGKDGRREKKKKGEKVKEADKPIMLTSEQKSEIATRELEELRDEIQRQKEDWGKIMDNYRAEIEEVEIRVAEIKKAMYEFKRDIVQQAVNPRTDKVIAERVARYFEDKIRSKDAIIEKVRLKNVTLKVQKNKLHLQLKQKEEMGEVLHAIDFDQLQIENKQYLQKIDERNGELLKLKMTAGRTVQILNYYKKKLQTLSSESERLRAEITQRKDLLGKLVGEAMTVAKDKSKADRLNQWLLAQLDEYKVPNVLDYVLVKASQHDLHKKLKGWERKVEIAAMQAQRMRKIWQQMSVAAGMATAKKDHPMQMGPVGSTAAAANRQHNAQMSHLPELPKIGI